MRIRIKYVRYRYCRYCTDPDLGISKKIRVSSSVADPHRLDADPDPDPACHFDGNPDPDPDPACHFDANPDQDPNSACHFDAYPDPSCQIQGQDLEKVLR